MMADDHYAAVEWFPPERSWGAVAVGLDAFDLMVHRLPG
jgi:hypothetical protein